LQTLFARALLYATSQDSHGSEDIANATAQPTLISFDVPT
jgi:hypothetical protein